MATECFDIETGNDLCQNGGYCFAEDEHSSECVCQSGFTVRWWFSMTLNAMKMQIAL